MAAKMAANLIAPNSYNSRIIYLRVVPLVSTPVFWRQETSLIKINITK